MGAAQASGVVYDLLRRKAGSGGGHATDEDDAALRERVRRSYEEQTDIRYGAARGWVDAVIPPHETRAVLTRLLELVNRPPAQGRFHTGVMQV